MYYKNLNQFHRVECAINPLVLLNGNDCNGEIIYIELKT